MKGIARLVGTLARAERRLHGRCQRTLQDISRTRSGLEACSDSLPPLAVFPALIGERRQVAAAARALSAELERFAIRVGGKNCSARVKRQLARYFRGSSRQLARMSRVMLIFGSGRTGAPRRDDNQSVREAG